MKYFTDKIDYPENELCADILPWNIEYSHISSTFLDGFINYVEIKKAFVIGRYSDWDTELDLEREISVQKPAGSFTWTKIICKTKNALYKELTIDGATLHAHLDTDFQDDVLILAKISNMDNGWIYFWYDRDCSDSCIGRFITDDDEKSVINEFSIFIKNLECNIYGEKEIPLHYFNGWIKS